MKVFFLNMEVEKVVRGVSCLLMLGSKKAMCPLLSSSLVKEMDVGWLFRKARKGSMCALLAKKQDSVINIDKIQQGFDTLTM